MCLWGNVRESSDQSGGMWLGGQSGVLAGLPALGS
jgi:hypothetical protein